MSLDKEALMEKINSAPNTQGLGGIRGLFGEFQADPRRSASRFYLDQGLAYLSAPSLSNLTKM